MAIKEIKIYDLDGTVICSMHRYRVDPKTNKIDLSYWIANDIPEKIMLDSLLPLAEQVYQDLNNPECYVIFATARACVPGDANYQYLEKMGMIPNKFIHRQGRDDTRGGAQLKIQAIKPLLNLRQFKNAVIHIFEDNNKYLHDMTIALKEKHIVNPVFVPSKQGH